MWHVLLCDYAGEHENCEIEKKNIESALTFEYWWRPGSTREIIPFEMINDGMCVVSNRNMHALHAHYTIDLSGSNCVRQLASDYVWQLKLCFYKPFFCCRRCCCCCCCCRSFTMPNGTYTLQTLSSHAQMFSAWHFACNTATPTHTLFNSIQDPCWICMKSP